MRVERLILSSLTTNENFMRKVLPFLKEEYLQDGTERKVYQMIHSYIEKYNGSPSQSALKIQLDELKNLTENEYKRCGEIIDDLFKIECVKDDNWLVDTAEKFCQESAIFNAIQDSIQILDGKDKVRSKGSIPSLLSDALGVSFDSNVGHDYLDNYLARYDFYHRTEKRIPFDLDFFNKITRGGLPPKTLTVISAGTAGGKSLFKCHMAASCLKMNYNVLYLTMEMSEERIAERIDSNLMNVTMDDIEKMSQDMYEKRMKRVIDTTKGRLIIKEYPTAGVHVGHFRALLNELRLKKNFKPDIIFVDYLNICTSARVKANSNANSYTYVKAIAEEIRGLAIEFDVPIVTSTQLNREGYSSSDPGLENTSESFGVPATADLMFVLISSDELIALNQYMVKQLKNRYSDPNINKKFVIGVDKSKMKLYDVEMSAQKDIIDDTPDMTFKGGNNNSKSKFSNIKV